MIGEKFDFNNRQYEIKRDVSFGEYKKISKLGNSLQSLTKEYESANEEDKLKIVEKFSKTTDDQLQLIGDFIESMLGLTQKDIDGMSLIDAISLFNEAFTISTNIKKKSETTLELPSSQTTPEIQP